MAGPGKDAFSQLLYPMLSEQPPAAAAVLEDLSGQALQKGSESNRLRIDFLDEYEDEIALCGHDMAERFALGGTLLACGNGGSATGAADLAAEFLTPSAGRPLPALCLTNDVAVVTAIANDVNFDDVFHRQVTAFGGSSDIVLAISTSGNSENLVRALREARKRGMLTLGLAGYDGGRMAREADLHHCFVVRSQSVHRIQEVQTTLMHVLWEVVQADLEN